MHASSRMPSEEYAQISQLSLTPQIDELTARAEEADRLKDQMDELRHAADRATKAENVVEKYKRKLEETADVRRSLKVRRAMHDRR